VDTLGFLVQRGVLEQLAEVVHSYCVAPKRKTLSL